MVSMKKKTSSEKDKLIVRVNQLIME